MILQDGRLLVPTEDHALRYAPNQKTFMNFPRERHNRVLVAHLKL
jgi:hypothetical protein